MPCFNGQPDNTFPDGDIRKTNHDRAKENAAQLFLTFDQDKMIRMFDLAHDEEYLYARFVGKDYRIQRKTGTVDSGDGEVLHAEVLALFDILCNSKHKIMPSGTWIPTRSMGSPVESGLGLDKLMGSTLEALAGHVSEICKACETLGGTPLKSSADVSFAIPVFQDLCVWFQMWDADDEFPASVQFLWDSTTPDHFHYEALYYVMMMILGRIKEALG